MKLLMNVARSKRLRKASMGLVLKRYSSGPQAGSLRPNWFGKYTFDGKTHVVTLSAWEGIPPENGIISSNGDAAFERSRARAQAKLNDILDTLAKGRSLEARQALEKKVAQHTLRVQYGREAQDEVLLAELWKRFEKENGGFKCTKIQENWMRRILSQFVEFVGKSGGQRKLGDVKAEEVAAFMDYVEHEKKLAAKTWNEYLKTLRRVFRLLAAYSEGSQWLQKAKPRESEEVSRDIFSPEEIREILELAGKVDPLIKSMVIVASCTGLRLKDICLMKWKSVDFSKNLISLKAQKTGGDVVLGMWPLLREELLTLHKEAGQRAQGEDYVLPEAAAKYGDNGRNQGVLLDRLRRVLQLLGYGDGNAAYIKSLPLSNPQEVNSRVLAALESSDWSPRRKDAAREYFGRYMAGETLPKIAAALGCSKGTVCEYIKALEELAGVSIIRRRLLPSLAEDKRGSFTKPKEETGTRARSASLRGWHSFRGSFVVAAIRTGVNMELIQKVLGARMVKVLYNHYIKVDEDFMREGFTQKVPFYALKSETKEPERALLMATPIEERLRIAASRLRKATSENWKSIVEEVLSLIEC